MYFCAGKIEQFDFAKSIGIGLIETAINLTNICLLDKPKSITFIGTAGSYGNNKIFDIIESSCATQVENSFFTSNTYTPIDIKKQCVSRETMVNSSNYITTDENIAKIYLDNDIYIENMEFYSIVQVAEKFSIPVKGIFIITNFCNKNAHIDFKKNHRNAMNRLTKYIKG